MSIDVPAGGVGRESRTIVPNRWSGDGPANRPPFSCVRRPANPPTGGMCSTRPVGSSTIRGGRAERTLGGRVMPLKTDEIEAVLTSGGLVKVTSSIGYGVEPCTTGEDEGHVLHYYKNCNLTVGDGLITINRVAN